MISSPTAGLERLPWYAVKCIHLISITSNCATNHRKHIFFLFCMKFKTLSTPVCLPFRWFVNFFLMLEANIAILNWWCKVILLSTLPHSHAACLILWFPASSIIYQLRIASYNTLSIFCSFVFISNNALRNINKMATNDKVNQDKMNTPAKWRTTGDEVTQTEPNHTQNCKQTEFLSLHMNLMCHFILLHMSTVGVYLAE